MEMTTGRSFEIAEPTQTGDARRRAMTMAREVGFDDVEAGRVGIVVTEASTNMVKHAHGGQLLVNPLSGGAARGIGVLALDRGPGMPDLAERMRDGFSSAGTSGTGLGAMSRQASQFDVYSLLGKGTAVYAGIWPRDGSPGANGLAVGSVCVPVAGEERCGDGWSLGQVGGSSFVIVTDGLGHGPLAHQASECAAEVFQRHLGKPLADLIAVLHDALRSTRGAAVALVEIVPAQGVLRFCGIGNVVGRIISATGDRRLVSHFGTLGHDVRRVQEFQVPWTRDATLVLHTDGLHGHWSLDEYPGLIQRDPALTAGVLFRDHARGRDDCTVVVVRERAT